MKIRVISVLAFLSVLWSCYPASEVTYSTPQDTSYQWLIEYRPAENDLQLTLRYRRTGNNGFNYNDTNFKVTLDQLAGLSRDQLMSTTGTNVRFQLKRDAGTLSTPISRGSASAERMTKNFSPSR
jgi:hypothetical protein